MLKDLQKEFYQDVLNPESAKNYLSNGNFSPKDLVQIYHHQYFISLSEALGNSYSCVKRLVGEDFFYQLAHHFVETHPSKTGSIIDYGNEFAKFIQHSPLCKSMPYLADVAKFERLYERCYFSLEAEFFMHSPYPVIKIWQLNENSEQLDFNSGGDYLSVYKRGAEVLVEKITQQQYEEKNEQDD
jgi:hypothetical protein